MLEFGPIQEQFPNWRLKYVEDLFILDLSLTFGLTRHKHLQLQPTLFEGILSSFLHSWLQNVAECCRMLQTVFWCRCLLMEASAKKSAAREALVYFQEHFQADGTFNMSSNLSTANRM